MQVYNESDLTNDFLEDATVAVLGYGNQGHAHAQNLRDSGVNVIVGARRGGGGWTAAECDGFQPRELGDAVAAAEVVAILLPDELQGRVFEEIQPRLRRGAALVFAHGFAVAFGVIEAPDGHDVLLVAPKGQGHHLRTSFQKGHGLPCLVSVGNDASGDGKAKMLSYARALGCLRAGAIETTFREEAVTDLFGEQVVLCGGVPALVKAGFETLVNGGYQPEIAYIECLHELKIITDLMYYGGIQHMRERISRTAAWGSFQAEQEIVDDDMRARMQSILESIESGHFAKGWRDEADAGQKTLDTFANAESQHPIESTGTAVRSLMPHLKEEGS